MHFHPGPWCGSRGGDKGIMYIQAVRNSGYTYIRGVGERERKVL